MIEDIMKSTLAGLIISLRKANVVRMEYMYNWIDRNLNKGQAE